MTEKKLTELVNKLEEKVIHELRKNKMHYPDEAITVTIYKDLFRLFHKDLIAWAEENSYVYLKSSKGDEVRVIPLLVFKEER